MSKYPKVKFGDFVEHIVREVELQADKEYPSVGVKWYGEGVHVHEIKSGGSFNASRFEIKANDIIYNDMWARNGSVAIVPSHLDGAVASSHFPTFLPDLTRILPKYLEFYFKTRTFWDDCENASRGSTGRNQIKKSTFYAIEIPLPSIEEQRRIVAHIESLAARVNEAQRLREEAIAESKALSFSGMDKAFSTLSNYPKLTLDDVCESIYRYPTFYGMAHLDLGIPVIRIEHILNDGTISQEWGTYWYVSREVSEKFPMTILREGDLVMGVRGSIGKLGMIGKEHNGAQLSPNCIRFSPNREVVIPRYLYLFLRSPKGQQSMQDTSTATAISTIKASGIKKAKLPVPPLDEQRRIVAYLDGLQAKVNALRGLQSQSQEELNALLPSVLDRAFKGEL